MRYGERLSRVSVKTISTHGGICVILSERLFFGRWSISRVSTEHTLSNMAFDRRGRRRVKFNFYSLGG